MTVNVSKPAFNIREKLSELDRPVGNHGSQLMRSHDAAESFDLVRAGRKNIIINGEHKIWQRGSSIASPAGTGLIFGSDRWMFEEGCGELVATVSRSADTPVGEGFQYSAQINVDTADFQSNLELLDSNVQKTGNHITLKYHLWKHLLFETHLQH